MRQRSAKIAPYIPMVQLHALALKKLAPMEHLQVYRGVRADLTSEYSIGTKVTWHSFTSTTRTMGVLEDFLGKEGDRTIFLISTNSGYDIKNFSLEPEQDEVLLPAGLSFECTGQLCVGGGATIMQLKEEDVSADSILNYEQPALPAPSRLPAPKPTLSPFSVARCVGPKPAGRTWRDEWKAAYTEDRENMNKHMPPGAEKKTLPTDATCAPGGEHSIEVKIADKQTDIDWKVTEGWKRDVAEGYTLLVSYSAPSRSRARCGRAARARTARGARTTPRRRTLCARR